MGKKNNRFKINFKDFQEIKNYLSENQEIEAVVVSGSMEPVLKVNQPLKIKPITDMSQLKKFDIVIFWQIDKLISHYLVCRSRVADPSGETSYITRGLNTQGEDLPVKESHFLGFVPNKKIPWYRRFHQTLRLMRNI